MLAVAAVLVDTEQAMLEQSLRTTKLLLALAVVVAKILAGVGLIALALALHQQVAVVVGTKELMALLAVLAGVVLVVVASILEVQRRLGKVTLAGLSTRLVTVLAVAVAVQERLALTPPAQEHLL